MVMSTCRPVPICCPYRFINVMNASYRNGLHICGSVNPLTPTVVIGTAIILHTVPDRVKPSFVILDIRALWRSVLSAQMSKITNDGLSWSGIQCFIVVPIWQQWTSLKGLILALSFLLVDNDNKARLAELTNRAMFSTACSRMDAL